MHNPSTTQPAVLPDPPPPERSRRPRLGFAGVGWIGRNRLEAIAGSGLAEIVAIADPVISAAQAVAGKLDGEVRCTTNYDDLLEQDIDGIVIATPSALHASQAIAAFARGIAVFCQKPLGRDAAETAAVLAAAARADRLLGVDLSYRYTAGMRAIRRLIQAGDLGRIYAIEALFHNAYGPDKPWFYDLAAAGGGCLLDLGIHLVDLAGWCLDFPAVERASGVVRAQGDPTFSGLAGVEDYACGQVQFSGGTVLQLACSWRAPAGCDARIELAFYGTKGGACFRNVGGSFYEFVAEQHLPDRTRRLLASPPDTWGGRAALAWTEQLARSSHFDPEVNSLGHVATVLDRLYGRIA